MKVKLGAPFAVATVAFLTLIYNLYCFHFTHNASTSLESLAIVDAAHLSRETGYLHSDHHDQRSDYNSMAHYRPEGTLIEAKKALSAFSNYGSKLNGLIQHPSRGAYFMTNTKDWSLDDPSLHPDQRKGIVVGGHAIHPVGYRTCQRDFVHTVAELGMVRFLVEDDSEGIIPAFEKIKSFDDYVFCDDPYGWNGQVHAIEAMRQAISGEQVPTWFAFTPHNVLINWTQVYASLSEYSQDKIGVDVLGMSDWGHIIERPGDSFIITSEVLEHLSSKVTEANIHSLAQAFDELFDAHPEWTFRPSDGTAHGPFIDPDHLCLVSQTIDTFYDRMDQWKLTWKQRKRYIWDHSLGDPFHEAADYLYSRFDAINEPPNWLKLPKKHKGGPYGSYLVHSTPTRKRRRDQLRSHFKWQGLEDSYAFILGRDQEEGVSPELLKEADDYDDIVIADFQDDYLHLVTKFFSLSTYYDQFCKESPSNPEGSKLMIKLDNDVVFYWKSQFGLKKGLPDAKYQPDVNCLVQLYHDNEPVRCQKCAYAITRRQWPFGFYPDYCVGPQFSLNNVAFDKIYHRMKTVDWGQSPWMASKGQTCMDDVLVTGILRAMDNIKIGWGAAYGKHLNKYTDDEFEYAMMEFQNEIDSNPPAIFDFD